MKKPHINLVVLLLLITSLIFIILIFSQYVSNIAAPINNKLTLQEKQEAINIVLDDCSVKDILNSYNNIYSIGEVTNLENNDAMGYMNITNLILKVPIQLGIGDNMGNLLICVDMNRHIVVEKELSSSISMNVQANVTIPPGAYWYHSLSRSISFGDPYSKGRIDFIGYIDNVTPNTANICSYIVDVNNLETWRNNTPYHAANLVSKNTGNLTVFNGTEPITSTWFINASAILMQPENSSTDPSNLKENMYALILKNTGKNDTIITYLA